MKRRRRNKPKRKNLHLRRHLPPRLRRLLLPKRPNRRPSRRLSPKKRSEKTTSRRLKLLLQSKRKRVITTLNTDLPTRTASMKSFLLKT